MQKVLVAFLLIVFCPPANAQQTSPHRYIAPLAGKVMLKDVDDKYNAQVYSLEMPDPDEEGGTKLLEEAKAKSKILFPYNKTSAASEKTTSIPAPAIVRKYVTDSVPGIPPDNYLAVSPGGYGASVINSFITVFDPSDGHYLYRRYLYTFTYAVGLHTTVSDPSNYRYDPKIIYDPTADKFICVILNGINEHNWIIVGFSTSGNPDSTWNFYKFYGDYASDSTWFDYPGVAITQNELFFTGNKVFFDSSWQGGFRKSVIYQVRKQDGYNGDTALTYQIWDTVKYNGQYIRNLYPVNNGSTVEGPSEYFLSNRNFDVSNDTVLMIKIADTIGSSDNSLTVQALVSDTHYGVPPNGRQKNDTVTVATNDGRILGGYRQGNDINFVSTSVDPGSGASGIYTGKISNYASSPVVTGMILAVDTLDFGYPNISYAGTSGSPDEAIITFDFTGPNEYPGMGAVYYDGTTFSHILKVKTGDSIIKVLLNTDGSYASPQRWGDYSGSQPDWAHTGVVWTEGIYGRKGYNYGNYIAQLASPYYTASVPQTIATRQPSVVYPNPAWQFISIDFTVEKDVTASFMIYDMQGRQVDKVMDSYCREGKNRMQFNIGSLAPGTYVLKVIDQAGNVMAVHSFVRQ